jgi:hypothetical protein
MTVVATTATDVGVPDDQSQRRPGRRTLVSEMNVRYRVGSLNTVAAMRIRGSVHRIHGVAGVAAAATASIGLAFAFTFTLVSVRLGRVEWPRRW